MGKKWIGQMALQALAAALVTAAAVFLSIMLPSAIGRWIYGAGMWCLTGLAGAVSAFLAVRKGLCSYAAWIMPPLAQCGVHMAMVGYPPQSAGMALVTALLSLVGAAAGQVLNEREEKARKNKRGRDGGRKKHG